MHRRVVIRDDALQDVVGIARAIADYSEESARKTGLRLLEAAESLAEFPARHALVDETYHVPVRQLV